MGAGRYGVRGQQTEAWCRQRASQAGPCSLKNRQPLPPRACRQHPSPQRVATSRQRRGGQSPLPQGHGRPPPPPATTSGCAPHRRDRGGLGKRGGRGGECGNQHRPQLAGGGRELRLAPRIPRPGGPLPACFAPLLPPEESPRSSPTPDRFAAPLWAPGPPALPSPSTPESASGGARRTSTATDRLHPRPTSAQTRPRRPPWVTPR